MAASEPSSGLVFGGVVSATSVRNGIARAITARERLFGLYDPKVDEPVVLH